MSFTFGNVAISFFVGGIVGFVGKCYLDSKSTSPSSRNQQEELVRENEKLKSRLSDMESQIEALTSSNKKHMNSEKESDNEIEDLEDEIQILKKKLKEVQLLNSQYESKIQEYKDTIDSLKVELKGSK